MPSPAISSMLTSCLLFTALLSLCNVQVQAMSSKIVSTVVRLDEIAYYMHPAPVIPPTTASPLLQVDQTIEPCTLLTIGSIFPEREQLQATLERFADTDDVWSSAFLQSVVLQMVEPGVTLSEKHRTDLRDLGVLTLHVLDASDAALLQPEGPYFLDKGRLHHAYRLYPDTSAAFMVATIPDIEGDGFRSLDAAAYGEQFPGALTVAVPSRLYSVKTVEKPYAGTRLAIKDIMDLKGLKTGASSRAFTELYPAKDKTADAVQHLVDMGFVVVGKLKTTQFADSEWPTCDWVDYHGPWNPRGDGYLTPSGSSAGSASSISSYQWLDYSLGTDTLGSIRSPSAAQGIFGMRPSLGAISTTGVVPYSSNWDTIGGFARTASEFRVLARALYGTKGSEGRVYSKPAKLIYPTDYWPSSNTESQQVFEKFITRVEEFLGSKRVEINLAELWKETRPEGTHESIGKHFYHAFDWSANRDQWTGLLKPFIDQYTDKFGKVPVLNPQVRFKVSYTPTITTDQKIEGEKLLATYHDWFYKNVMPPSEDGYSDSIMILPWTNGEPDYRDKYKDGPQQFTGQGFFFYNIGPYAQCPELIFPVGNTSYTSKFTGKVEQLPAALGLIAAKGSDVMLADFVGSLFEGEASQLPVSSQKTLEDEL